MLGSSHLYLSICAGAGSEPGDAQEQGDHEDVTTKEDARPDGLVSAYWETIGEHSCCHAVLNSCEMVIWERDGQNQAFSSVSAYWETIGAAIHAVPFSVDLMIGRDKAQEIIPIMHYEVSVLTDNPLVSTPAWMHVTLIKLRYDSWETNSRC